ncbi:MAG: MBL fold metallo-hydrolase [Eubacteriales bacterium]
MMNIQCAPGGPIGANSYFVWDNDGTAVLIDPTDSAAADRLISSTGAELSAILLTHGHFDHVYAQNIIKKRYGVPSYLHILDADMISDPVINSACLMGGQLDDYRFGSADNLLSGGETLRFGKLIFKVHHTPGHTDGSVCYECHIENSDAPSCLFSGDTLFRLSVGRCDLYGGDPSKMKSSLRYISSLDRVNDIYPGHGPKTTLDFERKMNPYLQ